MKKSVNIAIIGGSGFWSELSHHKHLMELRKRFALKLSAIVDPINPRMVHKHENMQRILEAEDVAWINPEDYKNTDSIIHDLKQNYGVNLVIIASNPVTHFDYGMSCIKHDVHVICDKPIVSTRNASTVYNSATGIKEQYKELLNAYTVAKKNNPKLLFHSILRRRSLEPFVEVATELERVYKKTGAGINNMTLFVNGGIYKFPAEFTSGGAHGYLDGIGSMAHSAYHYLDIIAWFLSKAPGGTTKIRPQLNYVLRVQDYLRTQAFAPLARTIKTSAESLEIPKLPLEVLGCELNSGFTFMLYNDQDIPTGEITFLFNHVSFTPRINPYDRAIHEPANHKGGGRVSHFTVDINQEGLQSWQIGKNDIVFEGNDITLQGRRHSLIEGESTVSRVYENAYEPEISMKDLLAHTIEKLLEDTAIDDHPIIRTLAEERLATELYASCYELIAAQYEHPNKLHRVSDIII
jgi:hypothetical protein